MGVDEDGNPQAAPDGGAFDYAAEGPVEADDSEKSEKNQYPSVLVQTKGMREWMDNIQKTAERGSAWHLSESGSMAGGSERPTGGMTKRRGGGARVGPDEDMVEGNRIGL